MLCCGTYMYMQFLNYRRTGSTLQLLQTLEDNLSVEFILNSDPLLEGILTETLQVSSSSNPHLLEMS